ncbi:hypothetical protein GWI33_001618 [Rhynchophorus ferrugineus]|uniref:Uncharacterized protein n=1 Tax=Rhynchophorus ferrugineus TaxID=354439 RepID=A0A834IRX8_RHYFE|nr:hypothetical protein GWI33_001618 [Rhynchophorus ferrugineus]
MDVCSRSKECLEVLEDREMKVSGEVSGFCIDFHAETSTVHNDRNTLPTTSTKIPSWDIFLPKLFLKP